MAALPYPSVGSQTTSPLDTPKLDVLALETSLIELETISAVTQAILNDPKQTTHVTHQQAPKRRAPEVFIFSDKEQNKGRMHWEQVRELARLKFLTTLNNARPQSAK